jgi:hypothetical protein
VDVLRAATPLHVGSVTLLPIERLIVRADRFGEGLWSSASKEAYAIVIRDERGVRVLTAGTEAVSLEDLRERIRELDALLVAR